MGFYRKSIRLKNYDYSKAGVYFITICSVDRTCIFGEVSGGCMNLNNYGVIAHQFWNEIPKHYQNVELDLYVIMPNHIHGILWLVDSVGDVGKRHASSLHLQHLNGTHAHAEKKSKLCHIIGSFKSAVTRQINLARGCPGKALWQKSYYEHIVRDEISLKNIRRYILFNPFDWTQNRKDNNSNL